MGDSPKKRATKTEEMQGQVGLRGVKHPVL